MVDEHSARFPWELFHDRLGRHNRPLAVETALIRQLEVDDFRTVVVQCESETALVVANPVTTLYPSLEGAAEEGRQVAAALAGLQMQVTAHIHSSGAAIRRDLYSGSYRLLHLAGHGVHQFPASGMVIGDHDFLTPAEIGQLRPVPELVFLNCCHLGRTDVAAANLAVQFIKLGVRAVIAAGWAVDDRAAATFAGQFYQSFLSGTPFGEAVREAREAAYLKHGHVNTWGAYQCYGDPGYRFRKAAQQTHSDQRGGQLVLPAQLALMLDNMAKQAKTGHRKLPAELAALKKQPLEPAWWQQPDVQAAEGNVLGEMGLYDQAVERYSQAAASGSAAVPIRVIEQEANLRARAAAQALIRGAIELPAFLAEIDKALTKIDAALVLGETSERRRIEASIHKRKAAFVEDPQARVAALAAMTAAYGRAVELTKGPGKCSDPRMNWWIGKIVWGWFAPVEPFALEELSAVIESGRQRAASDPSFWNSVIEPDGRLVQLLLAERLPEEDAGSIGRLYRKAASQGASPLEVATIREHVELIGRLAGHAGRDELQASLRAIRALL